MAKLNQKAIQLESFLRERIRKAIAEQMSTMTEWVPGGDESAENFPPEHGEIKVDDDSGEILMWSAPEGKWVNADGLTGEVDVNGQPMPQSFPEDPDPEDAMDPENKQRMLDSMLSMEFDENKQIQMEHLNKMIKESVRRHLKPEKK